jgi:hypothetical protein
MLTVGCVAGWLSANRVFDTFCGRIEEGQQIDAVITPLQQEFGHDS